MCVCVCVYIYIYIYIYIYVYRGGGYLVGPVGHPGVGRAQRVDGDRVLRLEVGGLDAVAPS